MPPCPRKYLAVLWSVLAFMGVNAQNISKINGFRAILERGCSDSMAVRLHLEIADEFIFNNPDTARYYASHALELAAQAGDTLRMAKASNYVGITHYSQGHLLTALEYYQRSQSLYRAAGDAVGAMKAMNNIGIVYTNLGEYRKAIETYQEAYRENMAAGHPENAAYNLFNMASGFIELDRLDSARSCIRKMNELARIHPVAIDPSSVMGEIHMAENRPDSALWCFRRAYEKSRREDDEYFMTSLHLSMAMAYMKMKNYVEAEVEMHHANRLIEENGMSDMKLEYLKGMADLLYGQGLHAKAFEVQRNYLSMKDSLDQINSLNRISELNARYESEKQESQIARQEKLLQEKSSHFRLAVMGGGALCIFAALVFANLMRKRRMNDLLRRQNREIKVQRQKIISSIDYARRIQTSILPSEEALAERFREYFLYFRPRDIVSGDIYWCRKIGDYIFLAVIDCTGHGVPGAFMSLIAHSKLNKVIADRGRTDPADILRGVHDEVVSILQQGDNRAGAPDGMDISLCRIDLVNRVIEYSGANNPICVLSHGQLTEYRASPVSLGGHLLNLRYGPEFNPFRTERIACRPGDTLFMFTDGMFDQIGGPDRKKMNKKPFRDLLFSIAATGFSGASDLCNRTLLEWKQGQAQTDDILILGVRL